MTSEYDPAAEYLTVIEDRQWLHELIETEMTADPGADEVGIAGQVMSKLTEDERDRAFRAALTNIVEWERRWFGYESRG